MRKEVFTLPPNYIIFLYFESVESKENRVQRVFIAEYQSNNRIISS